MSSSKPSEFLSEAEHTSQQAASKTLQVNQDLSAIALPRVALGLVHETLGPLLALIHTQVTSLGTLRDGSADEILFDGLQHED